MNVVCVKSKMQQKLNASLIANATLSSTASRELMMTVTPIAVATIMHTRISAFKNAFVTHMRNNVPYSIFKPFPNNAYVGCVRQWTEGALDAIQHNYLRLMELTFFDPSDNDTVLESYQFKFKYLGDDLTPVHNPMENAELERMTDHFLIALQHLSNFDCIEGENLGVTVHLDFHENTPENYKPPYFDKVQYRKRTEKDEKVIYHLGAINTGFHSISCRASGKTFSDDTNTSASVNSGNEEIDEEKNHASINLDDTYSTIKSPPSIHETDF